jgi:hypothetical protein
VNGLFAIMVFPSLGKIVYDKIPKKRPLWRPVFGGIVLVVLVHLSVVAAAIVNLVNPFINDLPNGIFGAITAAATIGVAANFTGVGAFAFTCAFFVSATIPTVQKFLYLFNVLAIATAFTTVVLALKNIAMERPWYGIFLSLFVAAMTLVCFFAASWGVSGLPILFLVFLTLLNAPFAWASLGITRALLRRDLELGGWWFFVLAIVDALIAAFIIAPLALTMVIGVQTYEDLSIHGGGREILPLRPFFGGIAAHPTAPEYWWVYALLFSTMIPSIINLVIGGASLMRGVPGVPSLLVRFMPANKAVPVFDRAWIATVLTLQLVGGAILGIFVQFALIYVVFWHVMPWLGLELLDMARAVAAFDLPGKLIAAL